MPLQQILLSVTFSCCHHENHRTCPHPRCILAYGRGWPRVSDAVNVWVPWQKPSCSKFSKFGPQSTHLSLLASAIKKSPTQWRALSSADASFVRRFQAVEWCFEPEISQVVMAAVSAAAVVWWCCEIRAARCASDIFLSIRGNEIEQYHFKWFGTVCQSNEQLKDLFCAEPKHFHTRLLADEDYLLPHAVNCGRFRFFGAGSLFFLFVYEISRELLNGFAPNSYGRRVGSLALTNLKTKVKGQRSRSPDTKNGIFRPFRRPACGLCLVKHL